MWVDDSVRFAGAEDVREKNNITLKERYKQSGAKSVFISGNYSERFFKAREVVNNLFNEGDL